MNNFQKQNKKGASAELKLQWSYLKAGCLVEPDNCDGRRDFNIRINGRMEMIEVKNEDNYKDSGNLCIELYQGKDKKRPSGLAISESTIFVHTLGDQVALYRTQYMRLWLRDNKRNYPLINFNQADNGNGGYIIPITDLNNLAWFDICKFKQVPYSKIYQCPSSAEILISEFNSDPCIKKLTEIWGEL